MNPGTSQAPPDRPQPACPPSKSSGNKPAQRGRLETDTPKNELRIPVDDTTTRSVE